MRECLCFSQFCILGIGLELACNGGSCGEILLKMEINVIFHLKRFPPLDSAAS